MSARLISIVCAAAILLAAWAPAALCDATFDLAALKAQAARVVPAGFETVTAEADNLNAALTYRKGEQGYQFTMSTDMDPQFPTAQTFTYKGRKAWFFHPGLDSSGAVMVILKENVSSLTVIYSGPYSSEEVISRDHMTGLLDKMDLDALN